MNGLYALKPWFAARLAGARRRLVQRNVHPAMLTWTGVGFGVAAGCAVALLPAGPLAGAAVAALLVARLACANLDGGVARESGRSTRVGAVVNELGDRAAELAVLAGCLAVAPPAVVLGAAFAATLPSWVALAGAAAGAPRVQGGPIGKTERCALLVVLAATGYAVPVLVVLAAGSLLTAAVRLVRVVRALRAADRREVENTDRRRGEEYGGHVGEDGRGTATSGVADRGRVEGRKVPLASPVPAGPATPGGGHDRTATRSGTGRRHATEHGGGSPAAGARQADRQPWDTGERHDDLRDDDRRHHHPRLTARGRAT